MVLDSSSFSFTVKGGKKTRQTDKEVGRQHQGMNRPGVCQLPEGSGEQRKIEETGCDVICGAPKKPCSEGIGKLKVKVIKQGGVIKQKFGTSLGG